MFVISAWRLVWNGMFVAINSGFTPAVLYSIWKAEEWMGVASMAKLIYKR